MYRRFSLFILLSGVILSSAALADRSHLSKKRPVIAGNDATAVEPLLSNIRQMTVVGKRAGEGYFSPNGRLMIFQSERQPGNPFYQMYLMNRDTGDVHRISPGHGKTTCGWIHPVKQKALFASTQNNQGAIAKQAAELKIRASGKKRRYSWDYDETYEIHEVDFTTGRYKNLTNMKGYDAEGSYSPDGRTIVFASNREAYNHKLSDAEQKLFAKNASAFMEIYTMNADGSNVKQLTSASGYDGGPFYSSDGEKIVWRRFSLDGRSAEIHTMDANGENQRQITKLGLMSWAPFYHPSGDYIIFASNRFGHANFELFIMDAQGRGDPVRVTNSKGFDGLPVFTPNGKSLSWTSKRGKSSISKGSQIFMADWDDAKARLLLGLSRPVGEGKAVAIASCNDCKEQISRLRWHVATLTSDQMNGRLTGTTGANRATSYVADVFRLLGLKPAGDNGTYFQSFTFTSGVSLGENNSLTIADEDKSLGPTLDEEWRPLSFSRNGQHRETGVVFAGFGIEAPETDKGKAYNSYEDADVKGKWVLMFRGLPGNIKPAQRLHLSRFARLQYKASVAKSKGAIGILVVPAPGVKYKDELVKLSLDAVGGTSSLNAVSINKGLFERIMEPLGNGFGALLKAVNAGEKMHATLVPDIKIASTIDIVHKKKTGRNVLARLASGAKDNRAAVILGAHVDHLGRGNVSGSLALGDEANKIHAGADDNASGVAALLDIAERFAGSHKFGDLKPERDIIFAAWSGEELGLIGSDHFTKTMIEKTAEKGLYGKYTAYLNMDMVGRLRDRVILSGMGSSSAWPHLIEQANVLAQLNLKLSNNSYLPTDATSFYLAGVPVLHAFTGSHKDYHLPSDTSDKINYGGLAKITTLMEGVARQLVRSTQVPNYLKQKKTERAGTRRASQVYLGTVPDYVSGGHKGLKLSGVMKGGPAEKAGLVPGDTIVRLAETPIENIYDYVRVINMLKIGKTIKVVVLRDQKKHEFDLTPSPKE
ncbi:MAG: M28 family peptidase [bacterium]|nr:M28 family peptidase [bacterium]